MKMSWNNRAFRKNHVRKQEKRKSGGGKKFDPFELEKVTFDVGENFFLRILRPPDGRVFTRAFHWPQGGGPHTCTRDWPGFDEKCVWCHYFPDKNDRAKRKENDVLEAVDFRFFHRVPHPTKDDKETVALCTHDEPDHILAEKRNRCPHCNSSDERIRERVFGGHKVLELNQDQYGALWTAHDKLSQTCIHVKEDGSICGEKNYPVSYVCSNPECMHELVAEQDIIDSTPVQLSKYVDHIQECPECGHEDLPFGVFACDGGGRTPFPSEIEAAEAGEKPNDADHWVIQGSMFDQVLEFTIQGEQKKIGDKMVTLKKFQISTSTKPEAWTSVTYDLEQFGFDEEQIEEICKPWDLWHRYRPEYLKQDDGESEEDYVARVLDKQAEAVGKPNPFTSAGGGARRFGGRAGARSFRS
jgi:hypothetical protein